MKKANLIPFLALLIGNAYAGSDTLSLNQIVSNADEKYFRQAISIGFMQIVKEGNWGDYGMGFAWIDVGYRKIVQNPLFYDLHLGYGAIPKQNDDVKHSLPEAPLAYSSAAIKIGYFETYNPKNHSASPTLFTASIGLGGIISYHGYGEYSPSYIKENRVTPDYFAEAALGLYGMEINIAYRFKEQAPKYGMQIPVWF